MITDERLEEVNILLCEDDESLGMLLREYLEAKGYSTTLCQDGEEGFDTFLQGNFSLCILDVMMPRMDGFTLASKIKELNYDMPFMFLTAKNLKDDVREGFELGADDYITKPFSMEEVVFRIEQGNNGSSDRSVHLRHSEADSRHWRSSGKADHQRGGIAHPPQQPSERALAARLCSQDHLD